MSNFGTCIDCKKALQIETDIQICMTCMEHYNIDKLWQDHDNGKIDALDFNESEDIRKKYRRQG